MLHLLDDSQKSNLSIVTLSQDIDNQRIRQSDWTRGTTDYTQPTVVASDATIMDKISETNSSFSATSSISIFQEFSSSIEKKSFWEED